MRDRRLKKAFVSVHLYVCAVAAALLRVEANLPPVNVFLYGGHFSMSNEAYGKPANLADVHLFGQKSGDGVRILPREGGFGDFIPVDRSVPLIFVQDGLQTRPTQLRHGESETRFFAAFAQKY